MCMSCCILNSRNQESFINETVSSSTQTILQSRYKVTKRTSSFALKYMYRGTAAFITWISKTLVR